MGAGADHPHGLHAAGGVDHAVDQVKRREAFEKAHPEWRIWSDRDSGLWRALKMAEGGEQRLTYTNLHDLLDALGAD